MSRTKYQPFWKAPAALWAARIVFGLQGIFLLSLFIITSWNAATKEAFTVYKLWPSGRPFYTTFQYSSDPHSAYWGALVVYCTICFVVGSFFSLIAYAATFRAVIPGYWKKRKPS
jgi:hypothetical protein